MLPKGRTPKKYSKAKKKGAHCEHLNYHSLSMLIIDYHPLFSDATDGYC